MNSPTPASVSIVIPNYNGKKLLQKSIPIVKKASKGCEIIVVDDASSDDSVEYLKSNFPEVKVIIHKDNQRFAAACNSGVDAAHGEIVVLLNSDVEPKEDFLEPLLEPFEDKLMFAVGCAEMNQSGNKNIISGRAGGAFKRGLIVHWRCEDQTKKTTLWVSGGSGAFRKSLWNELGGMDILFKPAYEEDRDICYRAMKRGYKLQFCPNSMVYHNHETTNKVALGTHSMNVASYKNHLILVWKNITQVKLFIKHIFWLPYHLIFTSLRSNGLFFQGFIEAIKVLPEIRDKRLIEIKESRLSDDAILDSFKE